MKELLVNELTDSNIDLLDAIGLIEKTLLTHHSETAALEGLVAMAKTAIAEQENPLEQAELLLNHVFIEQLFLDHNRAHWPLDSFVIDKGIEGRKLSPTLKAIVMCYVINQCDLTADIIVLPKQAFVRIVCNEVYAIIFDPVTGIL